MKKILIGIALVGVIWGSWVVADILFPEFYEGTINQYGSSTIRYYPGKRVPYGGYTLVCPSEDIMKRIESGENLDTVYPSECVDKKYIQTAVVNIQSNRLERCVGEVSLIPGEHRQWVSHSSVVCNRVVPLLGFEFGRRMGKVETTYPHKDVVIQIKFLHSNEIVVLNKNIENN